MANLKIIYKTGQLDCYLYSFKNKETKEKEWRRVKEKPIKYIFINNEVPEDIDTTILEDIKQLYNKMEIYLKKKNSIFQDNLDIIKAFNTYKYKNYELLKYNINGQLVDFELKF